VQNFIELDTKDLILSLGLIALTILLAQWQNLKLTNQILIGTGRAILQLTILGYVLDLIFALDSPWAVIALLLSMTTIAAVVSKNRIGEKINRLFPLMWGSIFISVALALGYTIVLIVQPEKWYDPQYLIPLTGMVLGNAMNSASLAGERLASEIKKNRLEIETHLSVGASPAQAIASYRKVALKTSLIPIINTMMVVGLVSLPGMFTGQVLSGIDPINASSYQLLILFLIIATNLMTSILVTEGIYRSFFNRNWQLIL
jgi:putative ABC transport system permease protein